MKEERKKNLYVTTARENTQHYLKDLLLENERLRGQITAIESELRLCREKIVTNERNSRENDSLHAMVSYLNDEKLRLQKVLLSVQEERQRQESERISLEKRLFEVETENRAFVEQYTAVEEQNSNLANLYVASYRLHETLDRDEVINGIQEIVINLIGSEEFGLYEWNEEAKEIELISSFGQEALHYERERILNGIVGRVLQTGERHICAAYNERTELEDDSLVACIPLMLGGKAIGGIAIFRLLEHKPCLKQIDFELFDLLATHAATALYLTSLHRKATVQVA